MSCHGNDLPDSRASLQQLVQHILRTMSTMTIESAANGVHGQPTCCLSQDLVTSSNVSSTEPSPTRQSNPADQKKRKKKKKANKARSNDSSSAPAGKPIPAYAERPSVLCISRNKHWKYISSYHVSPLVSYVVVLPVQRYHLVVFLRRVIRVRGSNSHSSCSSPFSSSTPTPLHSPVRSHPRKLYTPLSTRVRYLVYVKLIGDPTHSQTTPRLAPPVAISAPCLCHIPLLRPFPSCLYQASQLHHPLIQACSVM